MKWQCQCMRLMRPPGPGAGAGRAGRRRPWSWICRCPVACTTSRMPRQPKARYGDSASRRWARSREKSAAPVPGAALLQKLRAAPPGLQGAPTTLAQGWVVRVQQAHGLGRGPGIAPGQGQGLQAGGRRGAPGRGLHEGLPARVPAVTRGQGRRTTRCCGHSCQPTHLLAYTSAPRPGRGRRWAVPVSSCEARRAKGCSACRCASTWAPRPRPAAAWRHRCAIAGPGRAGFRRRKP